MEWSSKTHGSPVHEIQAKMYQNGFKMSSKINPKPLKIDPEMHSHFWYILMTQNGSKMGPLFGNIFDFFKISVIFGV